MSATLEDMGAVPRYSGFKVFSWPVPELKEGGFTPWCRDLFGRRVDGDFDFGAGPVAVNVCVPNSFAGSIRQLLAWVERALFETGVFAKDVLIGEFAVWLGEHDGEFLYLRVHYNREVAA